MNIAQDCKKNFNQVLRLVKKPISDSIIIIKQYAIDNNSRFKCQRSDYLLNNDFSLLVFIV